MKWMDYHKNVHIHHVERPDAISQFLEQSKTIVNNYQLCPGQFTLDKCWVTQNCWFLLHTTFSGISVAYTFRIATHPILIPKWNYPITEFTGVFSYQLLVHAKALELHVVTHNLQPSMHFKSPTFGGRSADYTHHMLLSCPLPLQSKLLKPCIPWLI
jgi:hypothetical protein